MAILPTTGWKNKNGTGVRACRCGSWKQHWLNFSGKSWPRTCSVSGCTDAPTLGAHVFNEAVSGERIVPMCDSCNKISGEFSLKANVTLVSANRSKTCDK